MQNYVNTQYCSSGSKKNRYGVRLTVIQNSQSIENNKSNITCIFELGGAGALGLTTDYTGSSFSGYSCTGTIYVNGGQVVQTSGVKSVNNSTIVELARWTGDVSHNADGTLSLPISGVFTGGLSSQTNGGTAEGWVTFDTIPRASTTTCTTVNVGEKPTITITSASSSFTHKLYYEFGSITKTLIVDSGLTGSTTINYSNWTIPDTFYAQIPGTPPSGTGNIICETYSGTTLVGTSSNPFTVTVSTDAKPNISNPTIVDTDTVSKNTIKLYVVGKSKLKFTFPQFSTNYSSTLKSYTLKINGTQVYSGTSTTYTMSTAISQTSNNYELIITDSRDNFNTTGSQPFTAYAYSEPKITTFTAERDATIPTTINITYAGSITNVNNNNKNAPKSFKIEYRQSGSSGNWTTAVNVTNAYSVNTTATATNVSDSNTFDFRMTVVDAYNVPVTAPVQVGTSATLLNFNANGATMAFGKASEIADAMEFDIKSKFLKEVNLPAIANVKSNGTALTTVIQNAIQSSILQAVFPVGSIYANATDSRNPNTIFGFGTWAPITDRVLVGVGTTYTAGTSGGSATHTHGLSAGYAQATYIWLSNENRLVLNRKSVGAYTANRYTTTASPSYTDQNWGGITDGISLGGTTDSGSNMPPYTTAYMWQRTA